MPCRILPDSHRVMGSPLPHLHRDWARPCHICTGTGLAPATSAPEPGSPLQHLHRDGAHAHAERAGGARSNDERRTMLRRVDEREPRRPAGGAGERAHAGADDGRRVQRRSAACEGAAGRKRLAAEAKVRTSYDMARVPQHAAATRVPECSWRRLIQFPEICELRCGGDDFPAVRGSPHRQCPRSISYRPVRAPEC